MGLKILWITSGFPAHPETGRNLYLWHPLEALKKLGVQSVVLNTQAIKLKIKNKISSADFPIEIQNCCYFSIPRHYFRSLSNYFYLKTMLPRIKKLHRKHQFDVIHAHGEINGLSAVLAAKKLGIPAVVTLHGIEVSSRLWRGHSGKMFQTMLNNANKIIYVGNPLREYFSNFMDNNASFCIIHNGFRMPSAQQLTHQIFKSQKIIQIISVSLLQEGKGVDLTLQALSQLKKQDIENWIYIIVGDGEQKKYYENLVVKLGLQEKVKFKGHCSHDKVYEYLQNSDIFCLPSYREAFGIVYAEAMANGLLTIGVKGQGAAELIKHRKTGLLVEPNDVSHLASILKSAMHDIEVMKKIADAGKKHVLARFTWEKHAEKLLAIYEQWKQSR